MDKNTVKNFRSDFAHAVADLEKQYGITLNLGTIHFDNSSFRVTMSAVEKVSTSVVQGVVQLNDSMGDYIVSRAKMEGFNLVVPEKGFVGSKFKMVGKRSNYTVTGVNTRAPKFCIEVKTDTGARYKMPVSALRSAIFFGHE